MRVFENQSFRSVKDRDSAATLSDVEFRNCEFQSCTLSVTEDPRLRSTARNIAVVNASEYGCFVESAVLEEVVIDGLKTHGNTLQTWGAVFKHVTLRGKIDYLMTSHLIFAGQASDDVQRAFDLANAEYYRRVDWALDISRGEFKDIVIRGVPSQLVRRDPETQVIVRRNSLLQPAARDLKYRGPGTQISLDIFIKTSAEDMVFVAPKRDRRFLDYLADIQLLRKEGIAERD